MSFQPNTGRQPSKKAVKRVAMSFDAAALQDLCVRQDFSDYANRTEVGKDRFFWHADNGSDVLAVAHLDHVQSSARCQVTDTTAGPLATSGALDDRLGVYVILDLLPAN